VTNKTIDINVVTFDRVYDYDTCMTLSWRRACARRGWGLAASGGQFGRGWNFPRSISRDSDELARWCWCQTKYLVAICRLKP